MLSVKEIIENVERNRNIMAEYFEPDEFLEKVDRHIFFAKNGCGDYYCYRILPNGETDTAAIYLWDHELFETPAVAEKMPDLIVKYYGDEIEFINGRLRQFVPMSYTIREGGILE